MINLNKTFDKLDERILYQVCKSKLPENKNYLRIIKKISDLYGTNETEALIKCFNYGLMTGKSIERDAKKWNVSSCYSGLEIYVKEHFNITLPKYQQYREWFNKRFLKSSTVFDMGEKYFLVADIESFLYDMDIDKVKDFYDQLRKESENE